MAAVASVKSTRHTQVAGSHLVGFGNLDDIDVRARDGGGDDVRHAVHALVVDVVAGHDVGRQIGDVRHVIVAYERQVRNRSYGLVDGLDIHARHREVLHCSGNLNCRELRVDADLADMTRHLIEACLERFQIGIRHP